MTSNQQVQPIWVHTKLWVEAKTDIALLLIVCRYIVSKNYHIPMNLTESFGARLQSLRQEQKISQEKLAELSGLHRTYISSLERGTRNPTLTTLQKIAKALDVEISYLMIGIRND